MTTSGNSAASEGTGSFGSISEDECRELLSVGVIGRVAFHSSAGPQLIPLNYFYSKGAIYIRVDGHSVLAELERRSDEIVFEVDYHDDLIKQAWSVMVQGSINTVTATEELQRLRNERRLQPWAIGEHNLYLRIEPVTITGRAVKRNAR